MNQHIEKVEKQANEARLLMKKLIFIHSKNKKKHYKNEKDNCVIYIDSSPFLPDEKEQSMLSYYIVRLEKESHQIYHSYEMRWTQQWAFKKLGTKTGAGSFAEELVFEGKSLWYPIEYFLHFDIDFLSYDAPFSRIILYTDCIRKILKEKKPEQVVIENEEELFNQLVKRVCEQESITVISLRIKEESSSLPVRIMGIMNMPSMIKAYIQGRVLFRKLIGRIFCKKMVHGDVLILTSDRLTNKENRTDYYWAPIVKELNRRGIGYKVVEYDRIESLNSLANVKRRYIPQKYDAQFIGTYYDKTTRKDYKRFKEFLRHKFFELDGNENFRRSFNYKGISFYELIRPRLKKIFLTYAHYIADVYAISKSVIRKEKPKAILIDHEKNYYGRALLNEANDKGIPSFAFEGEAVYGSNSYQTQVPVKEILNTRSPLWRPIPNKKFVWGSYSKEWYEKKNYFPNKNLKVIGAPKYDFLKELSEKDTREMRSKYDLSKEEKLITVITAEWPRQKEYLNTIFKTLKEDKKYKKYKIVIKMHPTDSPFNKGMIKKLIRKNSANAVVVQYENCSKLIHASELVITIASTLVYECVLINKRTIMFGSDEDKEQPYINEGLIKLCKKSSELNNEIRKALQITQAMPSLLRQKFIRKYLYSDDGRASERAVDEIEKVLKKYS